MKTDNAISKQIKSHVSFIESFKTEKGAFGTKHLHELVAESEKLVEQFQQVKLENKELKIALKDFYEAIRSEYKLPPSIKIESLLKSLPK